MSQGGHKHFKGSGWWESLPGDVKEKLQTVETMWKTCQINKLEYESAKYFLAKQLPPDNNTPL